MKDLMPGLLELHIAKVADNTFVLRSDRGVVVTAPTFAAVVKRAREFFSEEPKPAVEGNPAID